MILKGNFSQKENTKNRETTKGGVGKREINFEIDRVAVRKRQNLKNFMESQAGLQRERANSVRNETCCHPKKKTPTHVDRDSYAFRLKA